ncbi:methyl-accepting chemotaxis protein [Pannonibacter sp. Pt2]|uniref:Methyl-accepting chemotaxis protein n=1 Tax=Pannonibacter anstelovis TaxID=3121537 RepID=A0ABU7ZQP0_9HYPH
MKIALKLPLVIVGIGLLCSAGVGTATYFSASNFIRQLGDDRLLALAENKKVSLEALMSDEITSAITFADSPTVVTAFKRLLDGWEKYGSEAGNRVTETYVTLNPNPPEEREKLSKAGRKPYDTAHSAFHPLLRNYMTASGFGDLLLIDLNGNVIYSVRKLSDYAINLQAPEWSDTPLAEAFQKTLTGPADNLVMSGIRQHEGPDIPTGYLATPVSIGRKTIGIMALELPHERIDNLLGTYDGLGETGNVMLTDAEGLALNDSKRTPDTIERMTQAVPPELASRAASGSRQLADFQDVSGESVHGAIIPVTIAGTPLALAVTQHASEMVAPLHGLRNWAALIAIAGGVAAGIVAMMVSNNIAGRIRRLADVMSELAEGNTGTPLPPDRNSDEIDGMTRAVVVFRDNLIRRAELEQTAVAERSKEQHRQQHVASIIQRFRDLIGGMVKQVEEKTGTLTVSANNMNQVATAAAGEASSAAEASSNSAQNVQTVAAAAEELTAAISEILSQAAKAGDIVENATQAARHTDQEVASLDEAADRIGAVVGMIRDIAEQTNLLALNATIEAARAGVAGKGFAVVAAEVKALSDQTARATDQIGLQIAEVQKMTKGSIGAIRRISEQIESVHTVTGAIINAVGEQQKATQEITQSIALAANGTTAVVGNVAQVSSAIRTTLREAGSVDSVSADVKQVSNELMQAVEQFLAEMQKDVNERRKALRIQAGEEPVTVESEKGTFQTELRDEAPGGLGLKPVPALKPGQNITVHRAGGFEQTGKVVWSSDQGVGVADVRRL